MKKNGYMTGKSYTGKNKSSGGGESSTGGGRGKPQSVSKFNGFKVKVNSK